MRIFISAVTDEFARYRRKLKEDHGSRADVQFIIQEDFNESRFDTLRKLLDYVDQCNILCQILGQGSGSTANDWALKDLFSDEIHGEPFRAFLAGRKIEDISARLSYTQWELVMAAYLGKPIFVFEATARATDGHPDGKLPFSAKAGCAGSIKKYDDVLTALRLRKTRFDPGYEQCRKAVVNTLWADHGRRIRELQGVERLYRAQQEEFMSRNSANESCKISLSNLLRKDPSLGAAPFIIFSIALINDEVVPICPAWVDKEDCRTEIIKAAIEWVFGKPDWKILRWLHMLLMRAEHVASVNLPAIREIENQVGRNVQNAEDIRESTELDRDKVVALDKAGAILQVNLQSDNAALASALRLGKLKPIFYCAESLVAEMAIESAYDYFMNEPVWQAIPLHRIEVFVHDDQINQPWELDSDGDIHREPVVVRQKKESRHWNKINVPLEINREICSCAPLDINQAINAGVFFSPCIPDEKLIKRTAAAIWHRRGDPPRELINAVHEAMDPPLQFTELPAALHAVRHSRQCKDLAIMYGEPSTEFPSGPKDRRTERVRNIY